MAKKYTWEGRTASGKVVKGVTEGPNEGAVVSLIESQNIKLEKIKEKSGFDLSGEMEMPEWLQGSQWLFSEEGNRQQDSQEPNLPMACATLAR